MTDPNWFYSSLAQSAAGVVGLLGAILSNQLQSRIERAAEQQVEATTPALRRLDDYVRPLAENLALYVENSPSQLELLRTAIRTSAPLTASNWYTPFDSVGKPMHDEAHQHHLDVETGRTDLSRAVLPHLQELLKATDPASLLCYAPSVEPHMLASVLPVRDGLPELLGRVPAIGREAADHLRILRLRTVVVQPSVLWLCLLAMAAAGVIVPLSFLSAYSSNHRFWLLSAFGGALGVLLSFIAYQIRRLQLLGQYHTLLPPRPRLDGAT